METFLDQKKTMDQSAVGFVVHLLSALHKTLGTAGKQSQTRLWTKKSRQCRRLSSSRWPYFHQASKRRIFSFTVETDFHLQHN